MHESPLGFRMRLPDGWIAVRPQELQRRMALLKTRMGDGPEARRVPDLLGGDAEVFVKDGDQMAIHAAADVMPRTAADVEELCRQISTWGAKLPAVRCRRTSAGCAQIAGVSALYIDQDAVIEGRRTLQVLLDAGRTESASRHVPDRERRGQEAELKEVVASVTGDGAHRVYRSPHLHRCFEDALQLGAPTVRGAPDRSRGCFSVPAMSDGTSLAA